MPQFRNSFISIILCLALFTCEKPDFPSLDIDYPILTTLDATEIDETGVSLSADMSIPEEVIVSRFGFIIESETVRFTISLSRWKDQNNFNYRHTSSLVDGEKYTYWPFAVTENYRVNGEKKEFVSQGGAKPEILDFYPKNAGVNDQITIIGRHFDQHQTRVSLSDDLSNLPPLVRSAGLIKADIDTIRFTLNNRALAFTDIRLSVISGGETITADQILSMERPKVTSINTRKGFSAETQFSFFVENINMIDLPDVTVLMKDAEDPNATFKPALILSKSLEGIVFVSNISNKAGKKDVVVKLLDGVEVPLGEIELVSRWEKIADIPSNEEIVYATTVNDQIYVFVGQEFLNYNTNTGTWTNLENYPGSYDSSLRTNFTSGDYIFFFTGEGDDFYRYNTTTSTWEELREIPYSVRFSAASGVIGSEFFGYGASGNLNNSPLFKYDINRDSWSRISFSISRENSNIYIRSTPVIHNEQLYLVEFPSSNNNRRLSIHTVKETVNRFELSSTVSISDFSELTFHNIQGIPLAASFGNQLLLRNTVANRFLATYNFDTELLSPLSPYITTEIDLSFGSNDQTYGITGRNNGNFNEIYRYISELN